MFLFADFLQHLTQLLIQLRNLLLITDGVGQNRSQQLALLQRKSCQNQQTHLRIVVRFRRKANSNRGKRRFRCGIIEQPAFCPQSDLLQDRQIFVADALKRPRQLLGQQRLIPASTAALSVLLNRFHALWLAWLLSIRGAADKQTGQHCQSKHGDALPAVS
ncbi:MAG: hypothetical protein EBS42_17040 [Caulobacteraceae bacterium]|nr:hypothetical protein [Caulobacteraceae bacterium]